MTDLIHLTRGQSRLLISVPQAGTYIPPDIAARLNPLGRALVDTDWHVDRLYDFAPARGATMLVATHARSVVDLNRSPAGGALYPGQAETTICPTESFDGAPLYDTPPTQAEVAARVQRYWQPYHDALAAELERLRGLHGVVHLLDAHSIRSVIPRLFDGTLPDLNYGTDGGRSADAGLVARAMAATADAGFSQVLDGRFRGGFITRHYGRPEVPIHAVQLELSQAAYMDEDRMQDGVAEHEMAEDELAKDELAKDGIARHGIAQQGIAQHAIAQHGIIKPGVTEHGIIKQGITKRGITKRGIIKRGIIKRGITKRGITRHGPTSFDPSRAVPLQAALRALVSVLSDA